jgi:putative hydrolase of the HAD superfamily
MTPESDHPRFHTVFLDVGGTIVDSPHFFEFVARRLFADGEAGIISDLRDNFVAAVRDHSAPFRSIRKLLELSVRAVCSKRGLPDVSASAGTLYRECFTSQARLYDDVIPTLNYFRERGVRMIVISDADADVLFEELELFGIRDYFDDFVISSEVKGYKPSRPMVEAGRARCREPLAGNLLVGDDIVDIETARRMGIPAATVRNTRGHELGADHAFTTLDQIRDLFD